MAEHSLLTESGAACEVACYVKFFVLSFLGALVMVLVTKVAVLISD